MIREILFRGKSIETGGCVFGFAINHFYEEKSYIFEFKGIESGETLYESVEVDPKTIGQWSGLNDKNGRRIYEHDILNDGKGEDACVYFTPPSFTACDKSGEVFWLAEGKVNKGQLEYTEVIGNIHDNN